MYVSRGVSSYSCKLDTAMNYDECLFCYGRMFLCFSVQNAAWAQAFLLALSLFSFLSHTLTVLRCKRALYRRLASTLPAQGGGGGGGSMRKSS